MDTTTLLIIILIVILLGGGGWYGRGRCFKQRPHYQIIAERFQDRVHLLSHLESTPA